MRQNMRRSTLKSDGRASLDRLERRRLLCGVRPSHLGSVLDAAASASVRTSDVVADLSIHRGHADADGRGDRGSLVTLEKVQKRATVLSAAGAGGVPAYSSRPGAPVTLILDFDGLAATTFAGDRDGKNAKSVPAIPAYNFEGSAGDFSSKELENIRQIYQIVAEKFSPMDVNVTTVDDGNLRRGQEAKILIGGDGAWWGSGGGVAIVGGFTASARPNAENIGFVWRSQTETGAASVGEAVAHEAGHLFGLEHQSTLQALSITDYRVTEEYAPGWVMGEGADAEVSGRWRINGPTSVISNDKELVYAGTQSDIDKMAATGVQRRADDHANSIVGATPLASSFPGLGASGVLERESDVDVFSFNLPTSSVIHLTSSIAAIRGMANLSMTITTPSGTVLNVSTSSESETWSPIGAQPAGTYFVSISSRGGEGEIGQYSVGLTTNAQFDNTIATATPIGRFGEAPGVFGLTNPIYAGRGIRTEQVSNSDRDDFYSIRTDSVPVRQTIWLYGMTADADVYLIDDFNGNQQIDPGEQIASSNASGSTSEAITVTLRPNRQYFIRVASYLGATTNYTLELRADAAGDTLSTARNRDKPASGGRDIYYDQVDEFEVSDFYSVKPAAAGTLSVAVSQIAGVNPDADVQVIVDINGNGLVDSPVEVLYSSTLGGSSSEFITGIPVSPIWNGVGGYFVRVFQFGIGASNYRLDLQVDTSPTSNPNQLSAVGIRNLGSLSASPVRRLTDYIGPDDTLDVFQLEAPGGLLAIRPAGPSHFYELIDDLNNNGTVEANEIVAFGRDIDYVVPGAENATRTMYVRVTRGGGEFPSTGSYDLTLSSQYVAATSDDLLANARLLSPTTFNQQVRGFVQNNGNFGLTQDVEDVYRVNIGSSSALTFNLAGALGAGSESTTASAGVQIFRDANGNGLIDAGERLAGSGTYSGGLTTSLDVVLEPGTYFVRVVAAPVERPDETFVGGQTAYTLNYQVTDLAAADTTPPTVTQFRFDVDNPFHQFEITFSEDVSATLSEDDINIFITGTTLRVPLNEVYWDAANRRARVSLYPPSYVEGRLTEGSYTVEFTPGLSQIRDGAGNLLATPFSQTFYFLPGDASGDGVVNFSDLLTLARNYGQSDRTFSQGDFDYNGTVGFGDLLILARAYGTNLQPASVFASSGRIDATNPRVSSSRSGGSVRQHLSDVL